MKNVNILLIVFFPLILNAQVVCDKFEIIWNLKGDLLEVSLDTDLPNNTTIMVSISRLYWEKGSSSKYSFAYISEKSMVVKWRNKNNITLDNGKWLSGFNKKLKYYASLGIDKDIDKISDDIEIRFIVPVRQSDPRFGDGNKKLSGKAIKIKGSHHVGDEVKINYPLKEISIEKHPSTDPYSLKTKNTYRVSKRTPIMPELNPVDVEKALNNVKYLESGGTFKVIKITIKNGKPWYYINVENQNRKHIGKGWINCTALIGQNLEFVK